MSAKSQLLDIEGNIPLYSEANEPKENPCESIVRKIADKGYDLESVFYIFDDNADEVLTLQEIKDGLRNQEIELSDSEMKTLIEAIDKNADGVCTMDEWKACLNPKMEARKEYLSIMNGLKIDNPLDLEERLLDLKFKMRRLDQELKVMRGTSQLGEQTVKEMARKKLEATRE